MRCIGLHGIFYAMHIHIPDPEYTSSARARANFGLALKISLAFLALLWCLHIISWIFDLDLIRFGIKPREFSGLPGVFFAPLLHGSFSHLFSNSVPLLILITGMLYLYPGAAAKVIPVLYLLPGLIVWLLGRPSFHIGASGLVYGLVVYVFVAGIVRRDLRAVAAALLVYFLYGTLIWGVLPIKAGVSWETHLAAAVLGLVMAIAYRSQDMPPRKQYAWETETEEEEHHR